MASQKFSNFSIDYILGDTSGQTPPVDHPSSPDFPGHVNQLYASGGHAALMVNHHPSPSWAGMYSCCAPVSYYQMPYNYYAGQQWPLNTPGTEFFIVVSSYKVWQFCMCFTFFLFNVSSGCGPAENQCHQHAPQRLRNRVRTVFTDNQTQQLEHLFAVTDYPTVDARAELAKSTGLTEEIVRVRDIHIKNILLCQSDVIQCIKCAALESNPWPWWSDDLQEHFRQLNLLRMNGEYT